MFYSGGLYQLTINGWYKLIPATDQSPRNERLRSELLSTQELLKLKVKVRGFDLGV